MKNKIIYIHLAEHCLYTLIYILSRTILTLLIFIRLVSNVIKEIDYLGRTVQHILEKSYLTNNNLVFYI